MTEQELGEDAQLKGDSRKLRYVWFLVITSSMAGMLYGYLVGMIGGVLLSIGLHFGYTTVSHGQIVITPALAGLLTAIWLLMAALASLMAGSLADWLGRRIMIIVSAVIFLAGTVVGTLASSIELVILGRAIQGLGVGIVAVVVPMYLAEISPNRIRGRTSGTFQLMLTIGIMLGAVMTLIFRPESGVETAFLNMNWRMVFGFALIPGGLLLVGSFLLPESPHYYFRKNREDRVKAVLFRTRTSEEAAETLKELVELRKSKETGSSGRAKWQKYFILPAVISISLVILLQLTGINNVLQYSVPILTTAFRGTAAEANVNVVVPIIVPFLGALGFTIVNLLITIVGMNLVDRIGRRWLLSFGSAGIVISSLLIFLVTLNQRGGLFQGYMVILGCVLFLISFGIGPGICIWLVATELIPSQVRGKLTSVNMVLASLVPFAYSLVFPILKDSVGLSWCFGLMAATTVVLFVIIRIYLPETKGMSLEEIENYWKQRYDRKYARQAA